MGSSERLTLEEYLQQKINHLLQLKGQVDMALANSPQKDAWGNLNFWFTFFSWFQPVVHDLLDLYYTLQTAHMENSERTKDMNQILRIILGVDPVAPKEELLDRAKELGEFVEEIRRRRGRGQVTP